MQLASWPCLAGRSANSENQLRLWKTQSACGPAVSGPAGRPIFDANIPKRYGTIRVEDVQADDVIRLENLPPNVPANDFLSLLAMADSAGSSNNSICERLAFSS